MDEIHIASIEKRLTGLKCPHCGKPADGGTCLDDRQAKRMPKPGDFAVCVSCGSINIYTDTLGLRRIERKEQRAMQRDPRMSKLIEICLDAVKKFRRGVQ